jgi:hypothetical protein
VLAEGEHAADDDGEHHHEEDGGEFRPPALQHEDHDDADRGCRGDHLAMGETPHEAGELPDQVVGVHREPEELGQLADQDGQAQPFM